MKKPTDLTLDTASLRKLAEQALANRPHDLPAGSVDEKKRLHELQVHQIESARSQKTFDNYLGLTQLE